VISEANLNDVPQLCDLLGALFGQEADFTPDPAKQIAGLRLILENPKHGRIFVMRNGPVIVGMVNLLTTLSARQGGLAILLEDLFVRTEYRGQGVATALLQHAVGFARSIGAVQITLFTDATNQRAIRLYQKQGFAKSGTAPMRQGLGDR